MEENKIISYRNPNDLNELIYFFFSDQAFGNKIYIYIYIYIYFNYKYFIYQTKVRYNTYLQYNCALR